MAKQCSPAVTLVHVLLQGEAAQRELLVQRLESDLASVKALGTKGGALGASDPRPGLSLNLPLAPSAGLGPAGQGTVPLEVSPRAWQAKAKATCTPLCVLQIESCLF